MGQTINRQSSEVVYIDDDGRKPDTSAENLNTSHNNMIMLV
jgi:hypothetical protein